MAIDVISLRAEIIYWPLTALDLAKERALSINCVNNLRQIGLAARLWSSESGGRCPSGIQVFTNELGTPAVLFRPANIGHQISTNWESFDWGQIDYEWIPQANWDRFKPNRNEVAVGRRVGIMPLRKTMNEWNIQSRARSCQACEKPFADKEPCHTLLFDGKQALCRIDVCDGCWTSQYQQGANDRKGFISSWHGIYLAPPAAAPEAIQKENAETLLRKLIEWNDPKHGAACFILAVMLERKRVFKVKEQLQREGHRVFVYEQPRTGDMFTITDPDLQLNQLEDVQRDVAHLLEHGLTSPTETNPAAPVNPEAEPGSDSAPVSAPEEIAFPERT